ncbi:acetyl-CoA acetyltransferase [Halovivax ruber XH-70]|uniref:Acetyl-CoA acetyltransferase n=1 Tax=Halovivax ruber (strain DSM 18193 / JCM 13892 / XH-70) TaxID=797302 RepID=L0IAW8_HALRX|nr:thiolase family protein [Halovivax ruber]AGB15366.1 acetyl-CoA acetyltransferase [Halovivax ruber XH-70]
MTFEDVAIVGIGETAKRRPDDPAELRSLERLYADATASTLASAGLPHAAIDGVGVIRPGVETPANFVGHLVETLGFENVRWATTADTGGSNAVSLVLQGALAIDAGIVDTFLCLGADAPVDPTDSSAGLFGRDPRGYVRNYMDPFGTQGPNSRLAHVQTVHADEYGTTREQLGHIAVVQRRHATLNPRAWFDDPIDLAAYLDATPIADPIGLLDCVIPVNAGFGVVLVSAERASTLDVDPVEIAGFGECSNYGDSRSPDVTTTGVTVAGRAAYDRAGVGPDAIDCWQVYDDYPIVVAMQLEDLGLCDKGDGGPFVAGTDLGFDGDVPLNTSGGQLSAGQPGMAAGFVQLVEGIRQLRRDADDRQVRGATRGVVTGAGGVAYGKNLRHCSVLVLERGDRS